MTHYHHYLCVFTLDGVWLLRVVTSFFLGGGAQLSVRSFSEFSKNINNESEKNLDKIIVTEPILGEELLEHLSEILFYARIID